MRKSVHRTTGEPLRQFRLTAVFPAVVPDSSAVIHSPPLSAARSDSTFAGLTCNADLHNFTMPGRRYDVFISYSRKDEPIVQPVYRLLGVNGRRVFLDWAQIQPGDHFPAEIADAIKRSAVIVLLWCCDAG